MGHYTLRPDTLERMVRAVEKVKERLQRAVAALEAGGVPYAVAGGNAVAAWVMQVDEGAVRNTRDVDILIRRDDLPAAIAAMSAAGFIHAEVAGVNLFVDGPQGKPSEGVHLLFAGEKVREDYHTPGPTLAETEAGQQFRVVSLEALGAIDAFTTLVANTYRSVLLDGMNIRSNHFELASKLARSIEVIRVRRPRCSR